MGRHQIDTLRGAIARLATAAPPHPPCFNNRAEWVGWLQLAVSANDHGIQPLQCRIKANGVHKPLHFDYGVDFCSDCTPAHRLEMRLQERCNPGHLAQMASDEPVEL